MLPRDNLLATSFFAGLLFLVLILATLISVTALPDGADNINTPNSSGRIAAAAESLVAIAGNVTEADFRGNSVTQFWQGFYGNISGVITLEDGGANVLYNWSTTSPSGEIYAANGTSTVNWLKVQCLNYTSNGFRNDSGAPGGAAGDYSLNGMNLSELHRTFGFNSSAPGPDNVSATFKESNTHDNFDTGSLTFSTAECPTAYVFNQLDKPSVGSFEEVILWDPANNATIWTSILENDAQGFDQRFHDFEMVVLENGASDTATTTYFFWVELQ